MFTWLFLPNDWIAFFSKLFWMNERWKNQYSDNHNFIWKLLTELSSGYNNEYRTEIKLNYNESLIDRQQFCAHILRTADRVDKTYKLWCLFYRIIVSIRSSLWIIRSNYSIQSTIEYINWNLFFSTFIYFNISNSTIFQLNI